MDARFRAFPKHSGARKFFLIFSYQSAVGVSIRGRRYSSYLNNKKSIISATYLDATIFTGKISTVEMFKKT